MSDRDYALGELDRRMGNAVRFGTISEIDHAAALVKVDLGDLVTGWIPWTTPRAGQDHAWNTPDVGEQVVLVSPGDPSEGVIIGSLFSDASPANGNAGKDRRVTFKDGTVVEFDRDGSVLNVTVNPAGQVNVNVGASHLNMDNGRIRLNIGSTTLLLQAGQATLTTPVVVVDSPSTTFTGDVTVQGSTSVQAITSRGTNISNTHKHSGVTAGPSNTGAVSG